MTEIAISLALLALGFGMLAKGADWFVEGASSIAARFGIPQLVIGLTIVAMGTSTPEAAVSISAALRGSADITIGNVLGSNILNILVILGLSAAVAPLSIEKSTMRVELPFLIAVTGVLFIQGRSGTVGFGEGVVLWLLFGIYFVYLCWMAQKGRGMETAVSRKERALWQSLVGTVVGLALIVAGSSVAVDGATDLARILGMSERLIGLTIVALGTSLPELFTSVSAAARGNTDIAVGNIVGSNIFNILFVVGTSALVTPVPFAPAFETDAWVAMGTGLLLLVCSARNRRLGRLGGGALLAGYGAYFVLVLL
ncbi:MAG: calcium/sodium antiporter [Lawsonibacter sp.]|nr:calcium/sodium antiporter [Lawsonibacter sp.]